jgi:hypothetical protein
VNDPVEAKMNALSANPSVQCTCDETMRALTGSLTRSGLRVMETFDLHGARLGLADCPCPYHGTDECDCQMVVLLIYAEAAEPATLILHGNDGQTWLSLVNNPAQQADARIQAAMEGALHAIRAGQGL